MGNEPNLISPQRAGDGPVGRRASPAVSVFPHTSTVAPVPAYAGTGFGGDPFDAAGIILPSSMTVADTHWIPAFAGMTGWECGNSLAGTP